MSNIPAYFELMDNGGTPRAPTKAYEGDAGWDLYTSRTVEVLPNSFLDVPTDIAIALPRGIWGHLLGRSSTIRRYGLRVESAVIDNGYRGEVFVGVWNLTPNTVVLEAGTRIAQLVLGEILAVRWLQVRDLPESDRQGRGFGSSGK